MPKDEGHVRFMLPEEDGGLVHIPDKYVHMWFTSPKALNAEALELVLRLEGITRL